ncbi:methylmalonyl-CoA mutase subunit beta [Peribacillus alkalitolerans]|uniref:methylmalonyl-CoA mutase subunit beta n=1 Tax=Peribacillus alkalitolerans TaxID=1550385 RepID=UPI0013D04ED2|nr:methylmalonyl-CoA mutase subunit beta [Peribacillus alkalitolerans]
MKLNEIKETSFPKINLDEWKGKAEESLKGKKLESLYSHTYEGIDLKPLYTKEDNTVGLENPGQSPYTRGISDIPYQVEPWLISQAIEGDSLKQINEKLKNAIKRGQNVISLSLRGLSISKVEDIAELFDEIDASNLPFFIDLSNNQNNFIELLANYFKEKGFSKDQLVGFIGEDYFSSIMNSGNMPSDNETSLNNWVRDAQIQYQEKPNLRTILVKGSDVHNAGGNAVQELAVSLSKATAYIEAGIANGYSPSEIANNIYFSFSIDNNFFMNVAKLRAGRRLWSMIGEAYNSTEQAFRMHIHAETSMFTQTVYDPHVNMLRATNQAFAAVVGGAQSLEVYPYDKATGNSSAFSERIAQNVQLILKHETLLDKVIDPAGGSWYVESLTEELTEKAWELFLQIDSLGGTSEALKQGFIQEEINKVFTLKKENLATRKESLIGTNVYPNPTDYYPEIVEKKPIIGATDSTVSFEPIVARRWAEEFELLRKKAYDHQIHSASPVKVGCILLKDLKSHKPRLDFVKGFLAAGGVSTEESSSVLTVEEVIAFVQASGFTHYVLCGADDDYKEMAVEIAEAFKNVFPKKKLFVAGRQKDDLHNKLMNIGIEDYIHIKSHVPKLVSSIMNDLGVN